MTGASGLAVTALVGLFTTSAVMFGIAGLFITTCIIPTALALAVSAVTRMV